MASTIYPAPTSGGAANIGTLAGGSLTFLAAQTGTTIEFTTVYPMAAGAYELVFKRLAAVVAAPLKFTLSLNGTVVASSTTATPSNNYATYTVYLTAATDFDTISVYNGGNVFQTDGGSAGTAALTMTAGRRSNSKTDNISWTQLASSPTITTSTPLLYASYPGYYSFAVKNTAETKIYYSYENAADTTGTPAVQPKFFEYDIATNTHTEKTALPVTGGNNTWFSRNVIAVNGKIYMQGGAYHNGSTWVYMTNLWEYDPTANTWTAKTSGGPSGISYVYSPNSTTINYFTSWQTQSGSSSTTHWTYNITTNTWTTLAAPATTWNTTNTSSYLSRDIGQNDQRESRAWFYDPTANILWVGFSSTNTTANYPIYLKYTVSTNTWSLDDNLTRNPSFHPTSAQYGYSLDNRDATTTGPTQSFRADPSSWYPQKNPQPKIGSNFITFSQGTVSSGSSVNRLLTLPANNPFYGSVSSSFTPNNTYMASGYVTIGTKIYGFNTAGTMGERLAIYVADTASLVTQPSYAI